MSVANYIQVLIPLFVATVLFVGALRGEASPWARRAPELTWGSCVVLFAYTVFALATVGSGSSAPDATSIVNLGLGVVGLVITALTGMALATSWRALDDSAKASKRANSVVDQYSNMVDDLSMISVYLEAKRVEERHKLKRDASFQVSMILAAGFSRGDKDCAIECLERIARREEWIETCRAILGTRGRSLVRQILSKNNQTHSSKELERLARLS
jgi:hypothetical protein